MSDVLDPFEPMDTDLEDATEDPKKKRKRAIDRLRELAGDEPEAATPAPQAPRPRAMDRLRLMAGDNTTGDVDLREPEKLTTLAPAVVKPSPERVASESLMDRMRSAYGRNPERVESDGSGGLVGIGRPLAGRQNTIDALTTGITEQRATAADPSLDVEATDSPEEIARKQKARTAAAHTADALHHQLEAAADDPQLKERIATRLAMRRSHEGVSVAGRTPMSDKIADVATDFALAAPKAAVNVARYIDQQQPGAPGPGEQALPEAIANPDLSGIDQTDAEAAAGYPRVSDKEAMVSSAQLAAMGLGPVAGRLVGRYSAGAIGSALAKLGPAARYSEDPEAVVSALEQYLANGGTETVARGLGGTIEHATSGGLVGASFDPEHPGRGAAIGAGLGILGNEFHRGEAGYPGARRHVAEPTPEADPARLLTTGRPPRTTTATPLDIAPEPTGPDFELGPTNSVEQAVAEARSQPAPTPSRVEQIRQARAQASGAPVPAAVGDATPAPEVTPPEHLAVRVSPIGKDGAYFSKTGGAVDPGAVPYDLSQTKLANGGDPTTVEQIATAAMQDPSVTPAQRQELVEIARDGMIHFDENDRLPQLRAAAQRMGYDGMQVFEADDTTQPTSVFIWNIRNVQPGATGTAPEAAAAPAPAASEPRRIRPVPDWDIKAGEPKTAALARARLLIDAPTEGVSATALQNRLEVLDGLAQSDAEQGPRAAAAAAAIRAQLAAPDAGSVPTKQNAAPPSDVVVSPEKWDAFDPKAEAEKKRAGATVPAPASDAVAAASAPAQGVAPKQYDYSSTQLDLPQEHAAAITGLGARIPDEHLADDGREDAPHITVKYGLHGNEPEKVRALLADEPPITVTLGKTSLFPDSGSGDVLKIDVDSPALHALNKKIADALPHTDTHPEYKPHATVAYLKKGLGKRYAGDATLAGRTITLHQLTFSGKDGTKTVIPFGGPADAATSRAPTADGLPIRVSPDDLPLKLATDAYQWNSMTPDRRGRTEQTDYVNHIRAVHDSIAPHAVTPEQKAALAEELERYRTGYLERLKKRLGATGRTASAMVTGPAKFPTARNQKALERERAVIDEMDAWSKRAQAAIWKRVAPQESGRVSSDDPDAIETLTAKLTAARERQAVMKAANKIIRNTKLTAEQRHEQLVTAGVPEAEARRIVVPDAMRNTGYPAYHLSNHNANIKRLEERVASIATARAQTGGETAFDGGRLVDNVEENRVQIHFDDRPSKEMVGQLKRAAFKWAPSKGVWQRQRTDNAMRAAEQLLGVTRPSAAASATAESPLAHPALAAEFDTPEIRAMAARAAAMPRTDRIDTPERNAWRAGWVDEMAKFTKAGKVAHLVMGLPGSGKTSVLSAPLVRASGGAYLDNDRVKEDAPEWEGGLGGTALHPESVEIRLRALQQVLAQGGNLVFSTIGDETHTVTLAKRLQAEGYTVHVHLADLPPDVAARRVLAGVKAGTRHFVDPRTILERGDQPRRAFAALAQLDGVIPHDPLDNDVPAGTTARPISDWRERWGFPDAEPPRGTAPLRPGDGPDGGRLDGGGAATGRGGADEVAPETGSNTKITEDGASRFVSARAPSGARRPVARVSTDGLLRELIEMEQRRADAEQRSIYEVREDKSFATSGFPQIVSTKDKHGGPSRQAKALKNLSDFDRITDQILGELATRMPKEDIWERVEDARAERDERLGAAGDHAFSQRGNELRDENGDILFSRPQADLFGEDAAARPEDQESLFGEKDGTAAARNLKQTEAAARAEIDRLRPLADQSSDARIKRMAAARIAELEKLTNRDTKISAEELRTRAAGGQTGLDFQRPEGATGGRTAAFYSRLERAITRAPFEKGTRAQWRAQLSKDVAAGEREWTGVDQLLTDRPDAPKTLTKAEVLAAFKAGEIRLTTRTLSDRSLHGMDDEEATRVTRAALASVDYLGFGSQAAAIQAVAQHPDWRTRWDVSELTPMELDAIERSAQRMFGRGGSDTPKFGSYTEAGGDDYTEKLLQLDTKNRPYPNGEDVRYQEAQDALAEFVRANPKLPSDSVDPEYRRLLRTRDEAFEAMNRARRPFMTPHWAPENIMAHWRFKMRTVNGEKVLHVEEVQSDWHQQGRKHGYKGDAVKLPEGWTVREVGDRFAVTDARGGHRGTFATREAAHAEVGRTQGDQPPQAPFKKTDEWALLVMKHAIEEAVARGADRIAWTNGARQADRFDISKEVNAIEYTPATEQFDAYGLAGGAVHSGTYDAKALPDVIGKEAAEKLLASPLNSLGMHTLKGRDLKIQGTGMIQFYDRMLPKVLRDYTKKLGAPVTIEPLTIPEAGGGGKAHGRDLATMTDDDAIDALDAFQAHAVHRNTGATERALYQRAAKDLESQLEVFEGMDGSLSVSNTDWRGQLHPATEELLEEYIADHPELFASSAPPAGPEPFHSFKITPALREIIEAEGQPTYMRTGDGTVGAGFDKSLFKKLGANLYKGDLGVIALKEGLQNASDSLLGHDHGQIHIDYREKLETTPDPDQPGESTAGWHRVLTMQDNGSGMKPETMAHAFVDVGGSEKAEGAAGGYGLAKVSLFANAERIEAVSIATMPDGTKMETSLTGSGADWQDGTMAMHSEAVPANATTGTKVRITFGKGVQADGWSMRRWLERAKRYGMLPHDITASINGTDVGVTHDALEPDPMLETTVPGAKVTIRETSERRQPGGMIMPVHVLNRGLYQFTTDEYVPGHGLPAALVVNVEPTVDVEDPDYPFTTSREELKKSANDALRQALKTLETHGSQTEVRSLIAAVQDRIPLRDYTARDVGGPAPHAIWNTSGRVPEGHLKTLASKPSIPKLAAALEYAIDVIAGAVRGADRAVAGFHFGGLGIDPSYIAVNISLKALQKMAADANVEAPELHEWEGNVILYNPIAAYLERFGRSGAGSSGPDGFTPAQINRDNPGLARQLARDTFGTLVHELAHQNARGHDERFAGELTRMNADALDAAPQVIAQMTRAWQAAIDDGLHGIARTISESTNEQSKNRLQKISGHQAPEGRDGSEQDDDGRPAGDLRSPGSGGASAGRPVRGRAGDAAGRDEGGPRRERALSGGSERLPADERAARADLGPAARDADGGRERGLRAGARGGVGSGPIGSAAPAVHPTPDATGLEQDRSSLRLGELLPAIKALFNPEALGPEAVGAAGTIRHSKALGFRELTIANEALRSFGHAVGKLSKQDAVAYWDAAEHGRSTGDSVMDAGNALLHEITAKYTQRLIDLGRLKAERSIEHYIGRFWSKPTSKKGFDFLRQIMGRRPLQGPKSFLKGRDLERFTDGLDAGLIPATYNWVDSQLAKIAEMQRLIDAEGMIQAEKTAGRMKAVLDTQGFAPPRDDQGEPWGRIGQHDDPAFTIFGPPTQPVHEAFDAGVREGLQAAIARLDKLTHVRAPSIGKGPTVWGYAEGSNKIATKFGGDGTVIMHELGHILDHRYGLWDLLRDPPAPRETVELKAGKRKGQTVTRAAKQAPDVVASRKTVERELRDLADLRSADIDTESTYRKAYLRNRYEKMANAFHALIYAPDLMQQVAPTVKARLETFLRSHSELAPILDIKPSLRLGSSDASIEQPGIHVLGHWYAPKSAAAVWNNHLSKGLRGHPLVDAYLAPAQAAAQLMLGVSGFHATVIATEGIFSDLALAIDSAVNQGTPATLAPRQLARALIAPVRTAGLGRRIMQEYRAPGAHPELARVLDQMIAGGFRGTASSELWTGERKEKLRKAFNDAMRAEAKGRRLWGAARLPLDALWAGMEALSSPIMAKYVPWMKTGATYNAVSQALRKLPEGASLDEVHRVMGDIVKEMDFRFGQVTYDNHFINNVAKHLAQMVFLAPGWTGGTLALMGRGVGDVRRAATQVGSGPYGGESPLDGLRGAGQDGEAEAPRIPPSLVGSSAAYWIGSALATMLLNGVLTYVNTGEHPHGKDFWAFRDGTTDKVGNPNRHRIPGYIMHDVYGWTHHPYTTFTNKLSPVLAFFERVANNRDYYGDMLYDPDASTKTKGRQLGTAAAKQVAPISVQNYLEGRKRGESGVSEITRSGMGVSPAPREFVRSPAQNKMADYLALRGHTARTPDAAVAGTHRREVISGVRDGTMPRDSLRIMVQRGDMTRMQFIDAVRHQHEDPLVASFKQLSLDEAKAVYALGSPRERELWRMPLRLKEVEDRRQHPFAHRTPPS